MHALGDSHSGIAESLFASVGAVVCSLLARGFGLLHGIERIAAPPSSFVLVREC